MIALFQLTASQGGWRYNRNECLWQCYFNSQPHKEADLTAVVVPYFGTIFQLTASQGGWPRSWTDPQRLQAFQLTASQGGWRRRRGVRRNRRHFNSQPHKEADSNFRQKHIYPKLIFLLIIHISLIFYSNHHILNYFSCKLYVFPGANVLEYFCELTFRTIILRYL